MTMLVHSSNTSVYPDRLCCRLTEEHCLPSSYFFHGCLLDQSCLSLLSSHLNRVWHVPCRDMPSHCLKMVIMCTASCIAPRWAGADSSFGGGEGAGFSTGLSCSVSQGRTKACQGSSWSLTISFTCTSADT